MYKVAVPVWPLLVLSLAPNYSDLKVRISFELRRVCGALLHTVEVANRNVKAERIDDPGSLIGKISAFLETFSVCGSTVRTDRRVP